MLFKVYHIIHGITCIKLYDHVYNKVSNSQAILALILKISLLVLLVWFKVVLLITHESLTVYTRSFHIITQSTGQSYTSKQRNIIRTVHQQQENQVENVLERI